MFKNQEQETLFNHGGFHGDVNESGISFPYVLSYIVLRSYKVVPLVTNKNVTCRLSVNE